MCNDGGRCEGQAEQCCLQDIGKCHTHTCMHILLCIQDWLFVGVNTDLIMEDVQDKSQLHVDMIRNDDHKTCFYTGLPN